MATSEISKTRLKIKAIADTITGLTAARNVLGSYSIDANTELFKNIVTDGPLFVIRPARMTERDQTTGSNKFEVDCELYFGFAKDVSYDWTAIEDLLYDGTTGLIHAFGTVANWRPGNSTDASIPQNIALAGEPEIRDDLSPVVVKYQTLTFHFVGC